MLTNIDFFSILLVLISVLFILIFWQSKKINLISLPCFFAIIFLIRIAYPSIYIAYKFKDKYSEKLLFSICLSMFFMILGFLPLILRNGDIRGVEFRKWYYAKIEKTQKFDVKAQNIIFIFLISLVCLYLVITPTIPLFEMFQHPGAYRDLTIAREESMKLAGFGYLTYVFEWMYKIFFPLLFAWSYFTSGFSFRTKIIFIVAIFYSMLTIAKAPVAAFFLIVVFSYLIKNRKSLLNIKNLIISIIIVFLGPLFILRMISSSQGWTINNVINSFLILIKRVFILTAETCYYWIVYFPDVYGSFLYGASNSLYTKITAVEFVRAPNLIFQFRYPGQIESGLSNTAFFVDAYANFGFIGLMFFSLIVGLMLAFIHLYFIKLKKSAFITACYICLYYSVLHFLSTSLTTSILTGGVVIIFSFALIYPNRKKITFGVSNKA